MQSIREGIQTALDYIEANLAGELDVQAIAARAYVSAFHFQRSFSSLCGLPLGEYIRRRRLTLAAQELMSGTKVIDAATTRRTASRGRSAAFTGCCPPRRHCQGRCCTSFRQ